MCDHEQIHCRITPVGYHEADIHTLYTPYGFQGPFPSTSHQSSVFMSYSSIIAGTRYRRSLHFVSSAVVLTPSVF